MNSEKIKNYAVGVQLLKDKMKEEKESDNFLHYAWYKLKGRLQKLVMKSRVSQSIHYNAWFGQSGPLEVTHPTDAWKTGVQVSFKAFEKNIKFFHRLCDVCLLGFSPEDNHLCSFDSHY